MLKAEQKQQTDEQLVALIEQGESLLNQGHYVPAEQMLDQASTYALQARRLWYVARIDQARSIARGLLDLQQKIWSLRNIAANPGPHAGATLDGILNELHQYLAVLPVGLPYRGLRAEIEHVCQELEQHLDDKQRYERAMAAIAASDVIGALRLLQSIEQSSPLAEEAMYQAKLAQSIYDSKLLPALLSIQSALEAKNWAEVIATVQAAEPGLPHNPELQQFLISAGIAEIWVALAKGQEALEQQHSTEARQAFEHALRRCEELGQRQAFQTAVAQLQLQIHDLVVVAILLDGREIPINATERDYTAYIAALTNALVRLEQIQHEGRSYPHVAIVLGDQRDRLTHQLEQIDAERRQLQESERLIQNYQFARAGTILHGLQTALLQTVRQQADQRLQHVKALQQRFAMLMERGRSQEDQPAEAAASYREAYQEWPEGPEITDRLVDALVRAGDQARQQGDDDAALDYFEAALQIQPHNERAQAGRNGPIRSKRLSAELARIEQNLLQMHQWAEVEPTGIELLIDQLHTLQEDAYVLRDQQNQIVALEQFAREQQRAWSTYINLHDQAEKLRDAGRWPEAVQRLEQAEQALKTLPLALPPPGAAELARWRHSLEQNNNAEQEMRRLLQASDQAYLQLFSEQDLAAPLDILDNLEAIIEQAVDAAYSAGGPISTELHTSRQRVALLRRSVEAIQRIFVLDKVPQRLAAIQDARQKLGDDPVLERLEQQFLGEYQRLISELRSSADIAHTRGSVEEELRLIRKLRELLPDDIETAIRYGQLEARQQFEEQVRQAEQASGGTSSTISSTRDALRNAINLFLLQDWHSVVPTEVRQIVVTLTALADAQDTTAMADDGPWVQAQQLVQRLKEIDHWTALRAGYLSGRWLNITREAAVKGVIATLSELGEVLRAYELAVTYRRATPTSDRSLNYVQEAQQQLLNGLKQAAAKQISRANEMLNEGEPAVALDHLDRLFEQFYTPIDLHFPGLLERLDEDGSLSKRRDEAVVLRVRATELTRLAEKAIDILNRAQQACARTDFAEATEALKELPDLSSLTRLTLRAQELRNQVAEGQRQQTEQQFVRQLTTLQFDLSRAATSDDFVLLKQHLDRIKTGFDWSLLDDGARERYEQLWGLVYEQNTALENVQKWETEAEQAIESGDLLLGQVALEKAIRATRDVELRSRLQRKLDVTMEQRKWQLNRDELLDSSVELLQHGNYEEARRALVKAARLNERLPNTMRATQTLVLLNAARAGLLLREAQAIWEAAKGLERGKTKLELAQRYITPDAQYGSLDNEIRFYYDRFLEQLSKIAGELRLARAALADGNLMSASLSIANAREIDSDHPEMRALDKELQQRIAAQQMSEQLQLLLSEAERERSKGNIPNAVELAERAQKLDPTSVAAQVLVLGTRSDLIASEALRQAQELLLKGDFRKAQEQIRVATKERANPTQLKDVQRLLDDLQSSYQAARIYPIRDLIRVERFQEALRRTRQELEKEYLSDDLHAELRDIEASISRKWPELALDWSRRQLGNPQTEADFITVDQTLQVLLDALSGLDTFHLRTQVEHQKRQVLIALLNHRLELIRLALDYHLTITGEVLQARLSTADATTQRRLAEAPSTLQDAVELAKKVAEEAAHHRLWAIDMQANRLVNDLSHIQQQQEDDQRRTLREQLLGPGQALLAADTAGRPPAQVLEELRQAHTFVQQALSEPNLGDRVEINSLDQQLSEAIEHLEQNIALFTECENHIRQYRFHENNLTQMQAKILNVLDDRKLSRYASERAGHLQGVLDALIQANKHRHNYEWQSAITAYNQAISKDTNLNLRQVLSSEIDFCRRRGSDHFFDNMRKQFEADEPDFSLLTAQLIQARDAGLLTEEANSTLYDLQNQLNSLEQIDRVQAILQHPTGNIADARAALLEARRHFSSSEWNQRIEEWERIIRARQACLDGLPDEAERQLDQLRPIGGMQQIVKYIREEITALQTDREARSVRQGLAQAEAYIDADDLQQAELVLQPLLGRSARYPEVAQLHKRLQARKLVLAQVDQAIDIARNHSARAEFEVAVSILETARRDAPAYTRVNEAIRESQRQILAETQALAAQQQFTQALDKLATGLRLGPNEGLEVLQQEVKQSLEHALADLRQQTQRALGLRDRNQAHRLIERMMAYAYIGDELTALRQLVSQEPQLDFQIRTAMDSGWQLLEQQALPEAVEEHYTAAYNAFHQAELLAPELHEARLWSAFAQQMARAMQVITGIRLGDTAAYEQARVAFLSAAQWLQPVVGEQLPAIFGGNDALLARRRRAAYNAGELALSVLQVIKQERKLADARKQDHPQQGLEAIRELRATREKLAARCRSYDLPPSGFLLTAAESLDNRPPQAILNQREPLDSSQTTKE